MHTLCYVMKANSGNLKTTNKENKQVFFIYFLTWRIRVGLIE